MNLTGTKVCPVLTSKRMARLAVIKKAYGVRGDTRHAKTGISQAEFIKTQMKVMTKLSGRTIFAAKNLVERIKSKVLLT